MQKIRLGRTGMMVTRLGFGGIPIQRLTEDGAVAVVNRCLDLGINFLDTANLYSISEGCIGRAIAGRKREDLIIATKTRASSRESMEKNLNLSLKRLGTNYIDLYQLHQVSDFETADRILAPSSEVMAMLEQAKKAGIIRHIGITSHQIDVAKALVKSERFDTIMYPLNLITCEAADELLPMARERDIAYIAMKPLAGGMLDNATIAFKYLFQFPDVVLIPGIEHPYEIEEIDKIIDGLHGLTESEQKEIQRLRDTLGTRFCRRCEYCQPCEQSVPISMVISLRVFAKRQTREWLLSGAVAEAMDKAANCIQCGQCETKCPYHIPIMEMIEDSKDFYEEIKGGK
jgi:uncharacterized protein